MTAQPASVSVTTPVGQAIDRVKLILFRPFDLGRWFTIGFCAWLATLGERSFSFNYGGGGGHQHSDGSSPSPRELLLQAKTYVMDHLIWILPLVVAIVFFVLAFSILFTWLRSRGRFMFIHCVALNKAEVEIPWNRFARESNSLFRFRLVLILIWVLTGLPIIACILVMVWQMFGSGPITFYAVLPMIGVGFLFFIVALAFTVVSKLTTDFVAPILYLRGGTCFAAWKEFLRLLSVNVGGFVLYLLFQIVLTLTTLILIVAVVLLTCCIAGCLMFLPYLGTVLLLPVLTFRLAYSLHYFAQYGPQYNVFPSISPPPVPTMTPPPSPVS